MSDAIFLVQDDRTLAELKAGPYGSEDQLQELLARYPSLLAGSQIDSQSPRRWLLVTREMAVAGEEGGPARWSLDHLFLDQDGIPTLVEVKRGSDTRIRREVVGQMLDYAANAVVHWPVELVRSSFEDRCAKAGLDPAQELDALLAGTEADSFWPKVKTNLQAGRLRLIFVADTIPPELRRIVEFLNLQMDPAEVLALEIKQYVGQGLQTLVPRIVGQTIEAQEKRSAGQRVTREWDEQSFFEAFEKHNGEATAQAARQIFDWASRKGQIRYGSGKQDGSFGLAVTISGRSLNLFAIYVSSAVEVNLQRLRIGPPFENLAKRLEFLNRLNAAGDLHLSPTAAETRPSFKLARILEPGRLTRTIEVLEWAYAEVLAANARPITLT